LIKFSLLRHLNFLASIISQVLAGMVELGLGFLLPFFLLLVVGVSPAVAGIALIPGTLPIILAGPLAGRLFDKVGGRIPLVGGFLVLAASGGALALGASDASAVALIPGLILQGIGLGVVLTVNDPTGLTAVPDDDAGEAAGMINTAEQMGGALGIAILSALELGWYFHKLNDVFDKTGYHPTGHQYDKITNYVIEAEQRGLNHVPLDSKAVRLAHDYIISVHVDAFQITFIATAVIALLGALACFLLVRKTTRVAQGPIFGRRSRWIYANTGRTPAITRHPPPPDKA
jgi:MFS family permease